MNRVVQLFTAFLFLSSVFYAQNRKLKKADKLYANYSYLQAAKIYEKLAAKPDFAMPASKGLALCYKQMGKYRLAADWYKKSIELDSKIDPEFIYDYALMLRSNENYDESAKWMTKFHQLKASDSRGNAYTQETNFITKQKSRPVKFSIRNLEINTPNSDFGAVYYGNRAVYVSAKGEKGAVRRNYVWNNQPFLNMYQAKRDKGNGDLSNPEIWQKKLETKFHDGPASFTPNLKRVYYTRNNVGKGAEGKSKEGVNKLKIYFSELKDTMYTNTFELSINNNEYSVGHPCVSPDGKRLFFSCDMPGGFGGTDIWYADINSDGNIGKPLNLGNLINTEGNEMFPFLHKNGMLFFASNGHVGFGGLDIFVAFGKDNVYKKVENVGAPVNGPMDDFAFVMNEFQNQGYFSSNREGGKGDDDIYSFQLLRPFENGIMMHGTATDKETKQIMPNAKITLFNAEGKDIADTLANEEGKYEFEVEYDSQYTMSASFTDYEDGKNSFNTNNVDEKTDLVCDLKLQKNGFTLYGIATDRKTGKPMENVQITITDDKGNVVLSLTTTDAGDFNKVLSDAKLNDKLNYKITLKKDGYFPKTVNYSKVLTTPGQITVHSDLDFSLDKIEAGTDLVKAFNIAPIYFDLNKFNIKLEAAAVLETIVSVLKEYPTMELDLHSHTDCRQTKAYNIRLSENRYKATKAYLAKKVKNGNKRLSGKGYGESQLVNDCPCEPKNDSNCTDEQHQQNRRTEFIIKKI